MDLRETVLQAHTLTQTRKIIDYVGDNATRFKALVEVFMAGPYRVTQRAAWPLSYCVENHPWLITPHFKNLLAMLRRTDTHVAVQRNILRLLQFADIPSRYRGQVATLCFDFLQDHKQPVAVRVFSMAVLADLVQYEPDLAGELRIIIEDGMPYGSPAFVSRAKTVLKALNGNSKLKVQNSKS